MLKHLGKIDKHDQIQRFEMRVIADCEPLGHMAGEIHPIWEEHRGFRGRYHVSSYWHLINLH